MPDRLTYLAGSELGAGVSRSMVAEDEVRELQSVVVDIDA